VFRSQLIPEYALYHVIYATLEYAGCYRSLPVIDFFSTHDFLFFDSFRLQPFVSFKILTLKDLLILLRVSGWLLLNMF